MKGTLLRFLPNSVAIILGLCCVFPIVSVAHAAVELQVGDPAPEFSLPGSDGRTYTLSQFRDKVFVVVAFFPKAFTGG